MKKVLSKILPCSRRDVEHIREIEIALDAIDDRGNAEISMSMQSKHCQSN